VIGVFFNLTEMAPYHFQIFTCTKPKDNQSKKGKRNFSFTKVQGLILKFCTFDLDVFYSEI